MSVYKLIQSLKKSDDSSKTPRDEAAIATAEDLNSAEYKFARKSKIGNSGEDVQKSARHIVNQWRGLKHAEESGTANDLVTRDHLLKLEPHELAGKANHSNVHAALAMHIALSRMPKAPKEPNSSFGKPDDALVKREWTEDGKRVSRHHSASISPNATDIKDITAGDIRKESREDFFHVYKSLKDKAHELVDKNLSAKNCIAELRNHSRHLINHLRNKDYYHPLANEMSSFHNGVCAGFAKNSKSVHSTLNEFESMVKRTYPDHPYHALAEQSSHHEEAKAGDLANGPESTDYHKKTLEHALTFMGGKSMPAAFGKKTAKIKEFDAAELYINHAERVGPETHLATNEQQAKFLTNDAKFRAVQWGNSVSDNEREHHLKHVSHALKDMTEILGLPAEMASYNGKLALAIGARGKGRALAHYEPNLKVINLTRKNGVGSLAHEWGHFFDHTMGEHAFGTGSTSYYSTMARHDKDHVPGFEHRREFNTAMSAIHHVLHNVMAHRIRNEAPGKPSVSNLSSYWLSTHELFARAFEKHIDHKLQSQGRKNTYLAGVSDHWLWPSKSETEELGPLFDNLFTHFKNSEYLKKSFLGEKESHLEKLAKSLQHLKGLVESLEKSEDLAKGQNGDWKSEGYTIHHEIIPSEKTDRPHWYPEGKLAVSAKSPDGKVVATASINHAHSKALMKPRGISVDIGHERKGLATAMYAHAEKVMKKKMVPQDGHQTPAGAALWKQPNRSFGRKNEKKIENYSERDLNEYNQKLGLTKSVFALIKSVDRSRWQSDVDPAHFGPVSISPTSGTVMTQAKAGPHAGKWHYFDHDRSTGKYGATHADPDKSKLHHDVFHKVVKPYLDTLPDHKEKPAEYDGVTNPGAYIVNGKPNPRIAGNPYVKDAAPKGEVVDLKARAKMGKSGSWHVKIKGLNGFHPLKDIKDLGPEKGNNYILHDGRAFHQSQVEDMIPAPKLNKNIASAGALGISALAKGLKGDWRQEPGYTFHTTPGKKIHEVEARKDGKPIANAILQDKGKHIEITNINVDPEHRRKGIADHIQKLAEETFKKRIAPSNVQTPEGKNFFRRKLSKSEIETLEKAAPKFIGEKDPEKGHTAVPNPMNPRMAIWQHDAQKAKSFQTSIDANMDKFTSQFGEHGPVLKDALNRVLANKKHVDLVPTSLKGDNIHTPRRRHVAFLTGGHPGSRIKHLGNGEFLWHQDRHAEGGYDPETWWKVNKQGIQDVTRTYAGKSKEIFGKSDNPLGGTNETQRPRRHQNSYKGTASQGDAGSGRLEPAGNDSASIDAGHGNVRSQGLDRQAGRSYRRAGTLGGSGRNQTHLNPPAIQAPSKLAKSSTPQIASVAVLDGDHLLMGKRNDSNRWTLPGGHLNGGEEPLAGAQRELREEAGISVPLSQFKYLGSDNVTTFSGKTIIVHSFIAYGRFVTDSTSDPDQEVQQWKYIDISNGLPDEIRKNLHSPKNTTLAKLGIKH